VINGLPDGQAFDFGSLKNVCFLLKNEMKRKQRFPKREIKRYDLVEAACGRGSLLLRQLILLL
jgi:hypothetical protein